MGMDPKTLRAHVRAGDIECRQKGLGTKRHHFVFTLADVIGFYSRGISPKVVDFPVRSRRTIR